MTIEEKIDEIKTLLGDDDSELYEVYLRQARDKILNKLYPFGRKANDKIEVPERYEQLQIELAITLYNMRGVEGQDKHTENSISRSWRSETEILGELTPFASLPL